MIHHLNQNVTADAKMYHTCLYVYCTLTYDHDCTQFWRSVSAAGHGNLILKQLTRPTRVRSPDPNWYLWLTICKQNMFATRDKSIQLFVYKLLNRLSFCKLFLQNAKWFLLSSICSLLFDSNLIGCKVQNSLSIALLAGPNLLVPFYNIKGNCA